MNFETLMFEQEVFHSPNFFDQFVDCSYIMHDLFGLDFLWTGRNLIEYQPIFHWEYDL